jgi:HAD superfamily hydrolase (TIGR01509 family)
VKPFPKVRDLFEGIKRDGKRIALASSGKKEEVQHYKKIARIDDLVECEISADDADKSKPAPDVFEAALDALKLAGPATVAIGDTPYDVEAANKAGISTIALLCGGFEESALRRPGLVAVYRDPADLLARYGESPIAR